MQGISDISWVITRILKISEIIQTRLISIIRTLGPLNISEIINCLIK